MISGIWNRLCGSATVAFHLRGQRDVPYWARPRVEALRDHRVRRTVAYAARNVPYYREWFSSQKADPRDIRSAADLKHLPVLDRELVRSQPRLFLAETSQARGGLSFLTSGSTGVPLEIFHDRRSLLANIAFGERERDPVNRACGKFRPKELYVGYESSTFKKVIAFYQESVLLPVRPQRRFVSLQEPIENVAALNNTERPDVLVGYGGWLDLFFRTVAARGIEIHRPKMVMYMGEALPHGGRAFIEQNFGIPVLSRYNAVESFKIGFFCEHRTGFHLHEDLCHVRIVSPDGMDAFPGGQGEVVLSNLVNRATVLLNYPLGDMASLSTEGCACGRTFRLLSELEGRVEDIVALPGGRSVHPRTIWEVLKADPDLLQYQLIQHETLRFELRLSTADEPAYQRVRGRALPRLQEILGPGAVIESKYEGGIAPRPAGKFRAVQSRIGLRAENSGT